MVYGHTSWTALDKYPMVEDADSLALLVFKQHMGCENTDPKNWKKGVHPLRCMT